MHDSFVFGFIIFYFVFYTFLNFYGTFLPIPFYFNVLQEYVYRF